MTTKYKKLENEFERQGFLYTLFKRKENIFVYKQQRISYDNKKRILDCPVYEVGIIKNIEENHRGGSNIPAYEQYPTDSMMGKSCWSIKDLDRAEKRFELLFKKQAKNELESFEEKREIILPSKEFNIKQLMASNNIVYSVAYLFVKDLIKNKKVKISRQINENKKGLGKATNYYVKI